MLDAFNNAYVGCCDYNLLPTILTFFSSSHARLEAGLNILITEIRAGRREGSVVSVETIDTLVHNNKETWDALRSDLEDIGITSDLIAENRQFIVTWIQKAVAAGKLDEDAPSDDGGSAYSSCEDMIPGRDNSSASGADGRVVTGEVLHESANHDRRFVLVTDEKTTSQRSTLDSFRSQAQRVSREHLQGIPPPQQAELRGIPGLLKAFKISSSSKPMSSKPTSSNSTSSNSIATYIVHKVIVKTLTGKTIPLSGVSALTTVGEIKDLIQQKEGVLPDQQRLVHLGKVLDNCKYICLSASIRI